MQRARRNHPLHAPDNERKRVEQEEERVLMLNQHQKDLQYFQKQEVFTHARVRIRKLMKDVKLSSCVCVADR